MTTTPLDRFHEAQMAADWQAAGSFLAGEFLYEDLGQGTRLDRAAYLAEYAQRYPDVWSDEPVSAVTDADGRRGFRCFRSTAPDGRAFVVVSDAEWDDTGRLTRLREIWHRSG